MPAAREPEPPPAASLGRAVASRKRTDSETATTKITPGVPANDGTAASGSPETRRVEPIVVQTAAETPGVALSEITAAVGGSHPVPTVPAAVAPGASTVWGAAADAGVNIGKGSRQAGVATAGFFSRLGKSIARSF